MSIKLQKTLLVVDLQNEFLNEQTKPIFTIVQSLVDTYEHIIAMAFINKKNSRWAKDLNWIKCQKEDYSAKIAFTGYNTTIFRTRYGLENKDIQKLKNTSVDVLGLETDQCVLATCYGLWDEEIDFRLLSYGCASLGGAEAHDNAIKNMKRAFGENRIIEKQ